MRIVGWIVGFASGFGLLIASSTAVNLLYRDVWMPLALITVIGLLFAWHPRLSKCPASGWFVALFGFLELYFWMKAVGPAIRDNEKVFSKFAGLVPSVALTLAAMTFLVFVSRNLRAAPGLRLNWTAACFVALFGWAVAYFSGGKGGADPMVQFVVERLGWSEDQARFGVIAFRKTLHFVGYGLVALSAYRLADARSGLRQAVWLAILTALSFALFDEFRQLSATNRTGSGWDVGLDMLGAVTFVALSVIRYHRRTQRTPAPNRLPG